MVSAEDIKRKFLNFKGGVNRKKRCGCIETKIITMGAVMWIQDYDLMCTKHSTEHRKDFNKQSLDRIAEVRKKIKRKRKVKKDVEAEH